MEGEKTTIIFHSKYPLNQASFSFGAAPNTIWTGLPLTTDANGDLAILEYPDGTFPYSILYFGSDSKTYTGTVTVTANNGYVDVTPVTTTPFSPIWITIILLAVAVFAVLIFGRHKK